MKQLCAFLALIFLLPSCTTLLKEPHYSFKAPTKPTNLKTSYDSDGRPIGFLFKSTDQRRGPHQSIWISVVNRGEPNIYAIGVGLPFIPDFAFEEPKNKIDKSKNLEIRYHAYSTTPPWPPVKTLPANPAIELPDKTILKPISSQSCNGELLAHCQIFTYGRSVEELPQFVFLETRTELTDGSFLTTPKMDFYYRDKIELIYHRGP